MCNQRLMENSLILLNILFGMNSVSLFSICLECITWY